MSRCRQRWLRLPLVCLACVKITARRCGFAGLIALAGSCQVATATETRPLDFSFIQEVPGQQIVIKGARLHIDCQGEGDVTVLFEAGLGGASLEWQPLQQTLMSHAKVCLYDRAGYAWSDPSSFERHAQQLALEADELLSAVGVNGPLILVGHSFGGFVVRLLADRRESDMVGLVLVDASHEDQLNRLEKINGTTMMPRSQSFVVSPVAIPTTLPEPLRRKIEAFSRMRKTYSALHAEMRYFRQSAEQVKRSRAVVDYPVVVVRRGTDLYQGDTQGELKTATWEALQQDLATISTQGELVVALKSGHHVHADEPELLVGIIVDLIDQHAFGKRVVKGDATQ